MHPSVGRLSADVLGAARSATRSREHLRPWISATLSLIRLGSTPSCTSRKHAAYAAASIDKSYRRRRPWAGCCCQGASFNGTSPVLGIRERDPSERGSRRPSGWAGRSPQAPRSGPPRGAASTEWPGGCKGGRGARPPLLHAAYHPAPLGWRAVLAPPSRDLTEPSYLISI